MVFRSQYRKFKFSFEPPTGDSITDKLQHEELSDIIKRFYVAGRVPPSGLPADVELKADSTVEDIDKAFEEFETAEVAKMDKVERFEAYSRAMSNLERLDRLQRFKRSLEQGKKAQESLKETEPKVVEGVSEN